MAPAESVQSYASIRVDASPEEFLRASWEALVACDVHRSDAVRAAMDSFWRPDGATMREAEGVLRCGLDETATASADVSKAVLDVNHLQSSWGQRLRG